MVYLITILIVIVFLVIRISFSLRHGKFKISKFEIIERDPSLSTSDYDQHIRRLNKYRTSNFRGITYFFSKKGGLYYYSKNNVRIYI